MTARIDGMLRGVVLASAVLCANAHATSRVDASLDDIYGAIGSGDTALSSALSLELLNTVPDSDQRREEVFQARIDVLYAVEKFAKPESINALRDAIARYTVAHPHGSVLRDRLDLGEDFSQSRELPALARIEKINASPEKPTDSDRAEMQVIQTRVSALIDGHLEETRAAAESALAFFAKKTGNHADWHQLEMRHYLGNVYYYTGSKAKALEQFQTAFDLAVAKFGPDSDSRLRADIGLAMTLADLGRNSEALAVSEASFEATRRRYGDVNMKAVNAESQLGAKFQQIGDYPSSNAHYAHAEATLAKIADPPRNEVGVLAVNYGNLLQEMDDAEGSLKQYRRALDAWVDEPLAQRSRAIVYANTGNTEFRMGRYDEATADFQHALTLREQTDGKDAPGLAYALEGLGSTSIATQHYADAQKYFERALDVRGRALAPTHPTLAIYNFGIALAHWGQGHNDEAFRYAQLTAENQQTMLATFATEFSERQSVAYRDILVPATALVVTLAAQRGDAESIATAWRLTMVERGLVARTEAHRIAASRSMKDPKLAEAWAAWRHTNSQLGEAWLSTKTEPAQLDRLRHSAEDAERALWKLVGRDPGQDFSKTLTPTELANALPRDGLLLAFTEGIANDSVQLLASSSKPVPQDWYVFALGTDAKPRLRRIGAIDALSAQIHAWYAGLRDPNSDPSTLRRNGLVLRREILDAIAPVDGKRLFVVPEGDLFRISFAALPALKQGYLIDSGTRVQTLAHESDLALPRPPAMTGTTLLAGAPDFPSASTDGHAVASRQLCVRASRQGFAPIPNAARELDDLQRLLSASSGGSNVRMVEGAAATKDNVLAALPNAQVIHLATHGFSLDDSCSNTGNARGATLSSAVVDNARESNATLSGLAFNGADVEAGHDPIGVLSAGELGTLDLSNAQWIALSACDSGLGPIGRNEGVFGMRRALRLAGARTVVMSLWQVDDAATADLMQSLYRARFVDHADVPDAMATAMQSTIAARRAAGKSDHPYYWAAFISEGGWR